MCGIAGVISKNPVEMVRILHDMAVPHHHRGQEGAGVIIFNGDKIVHERRLSLTGNPITELFDKFINIEVKAHLGLTHNRYSTFGPADKIENVQPSLLSTKYGKIAIAHNGTLVHAPEIKARLKGDGESFASDSDTEVILKLIARSKKKDLVDAIIESLEQVSLAYSVIFMTKDLLIAARDPYGFRPLVLAEFDTGYMLASETCGFSALPDDYHVKFLREIKPGEIVVISKNGLESIRPFKRVCPKQCIFELIYFARPDSRIFSHDVYEFRQSLGRAHAEQHNIRVDQIIGVPDSANYFADGHAEALGVPHGRAIVRSHSSGRTFIDPDTLRRAKKVRLKLSPIKGMIAGQSCSVDDDTIVRGNTCRRIVEMIKNCGPKSITLSVGSPPIISHCPYGIDIKHKEELIAADKTVEQICEIIGADDLRYLGLPQFKKIGGENFCYGCFDGKYFH